MNQQMSLCGVTDVPDRQVGRQTGRLPESHEECEGKQQSSKGHTVTQVVDDNCNLIMNFTLPLNTQETHRRQTGNTQETQQSV